jgi:hypothetical protein
MSHRCLPCELRTRFAPGQFLASGSDDAALGTPDFVELLPRPPQGPRIPPPPTPPLRRPQTLLTSSAVHARRCASQDLAEALLGLEGVQ